MCDERASKEEGTGVRMSVRMGARLTSTSSWVLPVIRAPSLEHM